MCGVFGYIGERDPLEVCLSGLEKLEYRGYDSTGIAGVHQGALALFKKAGKLSFLRNKIDLPTLEVAIAHTRWATHGKVSDENAHPHFDAKSSLAIIHNGIIENFNELKEELLKEGVQFASETDTEVIAHLLSRHYRGDLTEAMHRVLPLLKGVFAIVCIHKDHPDQIIASARNCPLSIAYNDQKTESIISSDPNTFIGHALNILFLKEGEVAKVMKGHVSIYGKTFKLVHKKTERLEIDFTPPSKEGFKHYLMKEIFEQPKAIQRGILGRFDEEVLFDELSLSPAFLKNIRQVAILGCGTSYHAGMIGSLFLEDLAGIQSFAEIASEARYRPSLFGKDTLVIGISQSGETADTLATLREAAEKGSKVLGLCNVKNSTLARTADSTLLLKAGPEISVCSTKAFTSELTVLFLFALYLGKLRGHLSKEKTQELFDALQRIPKKIEEILAKAEEIRKVAEEYAHFRDFFFMGRRHMFPTCLEAALKLKEISYANANGYPGGELKHGAIALLNPEFPVVAFLSNLQTEEKILSNLMEVKARGAPVLAFAPQRLEGALKVIDDVIFLPEEIDPLAPFLASAAGQLFAYFVADSKGCDIDQPRNLAKSVTVE